MERSLLSELNKSNLTAYVNALREAKLKTMYWQQFFPLKASATLTWESLTGSAGVPVMADVIEYNSSAPLKSRVVVSKASGDIPKLALKYKMDEKDYNDYLYYKAMAAGDSMKTALLDLIFDDVQRAWIGVQARTEYMDLQALSTGAHTLTLSNNNGIITEADVDFGIPSGNKSGVAVPWATWASATPLKNIRDKVAIITSAGYSCNYIIMPQATWFELVACTEAKDAYAFYQGLTTGRIANPALDMVNNMLAAEMLPKIIVVNSIVRFENSEHVITTLYPWQAHCVAFVSDLAVGNTKHGPIAEEQSASLQKITVSTKRDHVYISKWSELEPFGEFTKGQANAFPTFSDVDSVFLLDVKNASWTKGA
jgi:hypothetical protein